jgi:hypothetical protein
MDPAATTFSTDVVSGNKTRYPATKQPTRGEQTIEVPVKLHNPSK